MMKQLMQAILVGGMIGLTGCTTMKSENVAVVIIPSSQVLISNVSVHQHDKEIHVTGKLRPASAVASRTGHVDIEFMDAQETVLKTVQAVPNVSTFLSNSKRPKSFSAKAQVTGLAEVRLVHHPDPVTECPL
jgi:hypothetical protein